jgi:hypothetical protein
MRGERKVRGRKKFEEVMTGHFIHLRSSLNSSKFISKSISKYKLSKDKKFLETARGVTHNIQELLVR